MLFANLELLESIKGSLVDANSGCLHKNTRIRDEHTKEEGGERDIMNIVVINSAYNQPSEDSK